MLETDVVILGAGLAGLSAASVLEDRAIVLEQTERPGGLVKTERFGDYWFDHVLHLLHFPDEDIKQRVFQLIGDQLHPCHPMSFVETLAGTARFPFQFHLEGVDLDSKVACLMDLAKLTYDPPQRKADNFEELLIDTFGPTMCNIFFYPYNRKMWKRKLSDLCASGFTWNIALGELEKALRGALAPENWQGSYNQDGWYPRPPADAPVRGMEVLSHRLAEEVHDLRLNHTVTEIDVERNIVTAVHNGEPVQFHYRHGCCSTIPLPTALKLCPQTPAEFRNAERRLKRNRVLTVALSVRGPRPDHDPALWRYYADETLYFTRLINKSKFDPGNAPPDGWCLMAEVVEPAEVPLIPEKQIFYRVREGIQRVGALPDDCEIIDENLIVVDPAYVVFSRTEQDYMNDTRDWLEANNVTPLGRYGRWSYTSMAQTMSHAFKWAQRVRAKIQPQAAGMGRYIASANQQVEVK
jgi:protoporphyrinogen oxidase